MSRNGQNVRRNGGLAAKSSAAVKRQAANVKVAPQRKLTLCRHCGWGVDAASASPSVLSVSSVVPSVSSVVPSSIAKEKALITPSKPLRLRASARDRSARGPASPATRISGRQSAASSQQPEASEENGLRGQGFDCPITNLVESPFNPRRDFPAAEIQDLAESIKTHGLLQPIVVRPRPQLVGTYEIVAGERRYQAAKKAGLTKIPVVARLLDDAQARELCVLENLQRKDLSAIEEAAGFQMILDAPGGPTQTELAQRLGVTQGHIANRLRILKLSPALQKRIISGEILSSHALDLLLLDELPALQAAAEKELPRTQRTAGKPCERDEVRQAIANAAYSETRPLSGSWWDEKRKRTVSVPKFSADERARLAVRELPLDEYEFDVRTPRATNVELWEELVDAAAAKKTKRDDAKAERDHKGTKGTKGKGTTEGTEDTERAAGNAKAQDLRPKAPTAAELKRQAEEEERSRKEQAAHTKRRVADFRHDWTRYLIGSSLATKSHSPVVITRLAWYFATLPTRTYGDTRDREQMLAACGVKPGNRKGLLQAEPQCLTAWLASMFYRAKPGGMAGVQEIVPDQDLAAIAATLDVDHQAAWRKEQAGPLTEEYWNIHTKDQLAELGEEVGVYIAAEQAKSVAVKLLSSPGRAVPLPRELGGKKRK